MRPLPNSVAGAALAAALVVAAPAVASETDPMIQSALSAAPPAIAATATVMNRAGEVLHQGNGPFTCFPYEGPATAAMCLDAEWMAWAGAWMSRKDFKASKLGLAYMLAGDPPDGGASNTDPFATEATVDNDWVIEGPHVMIIVPDPAMLEAITTDPDAGAPYVMWKGTPYEHVMMPVAPRVQ